MDLLEQNETNGVKRKIEVLKERDVERKRVQKGAGVLCARTRKVHNGTKIHRRAKEIFVLRATKINVL